MKKFTTILVLALAVPHVAQAFQFPTPIIVVSQAEEEQAAEVQQPTSLQQAADVLNQGGEEMAATETPTDLPSLVEGVKDVYSDWKTGGWMAGLLALVSLLMGALRFPPLNSYFEAKKIMWLKPILAAVLGAAGAALAAAQTGASIGPALVSGLLAGLSAVGLYELWKRRKAENRTK